MKHYDQREGVYRVVGTKRRDTIQHLFGIDNNIFWME